MGDFVRESSAEIDEKTRRGVENTLKLAADAPHMVYQTGREGAQLIKEGCYHNQRPPSWLPRNVLPRNVAPVR